MSDNVGLSTPRGSGTSGYVQRNLAHLKPRDRPAPYPPRDGGGLEHPRHRQRQPDQKILEHARKREVEVEVFELRDRLEDEGVDEESIDEQCAALRSKLLAEQQQQQQQSSRRGNGRDEALRRGKNLKAHQVHELAAAKIAESERLRNALKISRDYEEGGHWRRQEDRMRKAVERDEAERKREDEDRERHRDSRLED
ncbi:Pre-mRNA-splicing factor CWC21 [Xylariomycetidae sp. FL0641]|nr:Pre-mRNA-splicing factor CWC21 [Xylariomycetidae sp. FL0641]